MGDDIRVRRNAANAREDSEWLLDAEQPHPYAVRAHTADGWWRADIGGFERLIAALARFAREHSPDRDRT